MSYNEIDLLNFLSKCSFEFGILDSVGEQVVDVNVRNTDDTITTTKMKIRDVMYFTEYGTVTIPGKFILEKSLLYINRLLDKELDKMIDEIFEKEITEEYLLTQMERIALNIQDYIRNYIGSYSTNNNRLGQILNIDEDENRYLYNLIDLKKYITCIVKIKN